MKVIGLSQQKNDPNRINVMVDGKYRFSLDISQLSELKIKIGNEYSEEELQELEEESQFGKLYTRALEYTLMRPHSSKEIRDYLYKKTLTKKVRNKRTGEVQDKKGIDKLVTSRVFDRLVERGHINDETFTRFWIENRHLKKGVSKRKLQAELQAKGVERSVIDMYLSQSERNDSEELGKVIAKKRSRYNDEKKLVAYLARQGFSYDDITNALRDNDE